MILKMLLKIMIPFILLIGALSYGMYTRGGNPGALLSKVFSGTFQSAKSSVQGAGDSLQSVTKQATGNDTTTVYKWVDENGVTQFGSAPPAEGGATTLTVKDSYKGVAPPPQNLQSQKMSSDAAEHGLGPDGKRLPGMAGMKLPVDVDPAVLSEFLQSMQEQQ